MLARFFRLAVFLAPMLLLGLQPTQGQQLPTPAQIQQLQQQFGTQNQGQGQAPPSSLPQPVILQPAVPPETRIPLPFSRLEQILSQRAGVRLQQFGYDQLGRGTQIVVPETGAVQDDYILGPGDEIVVSLRGQENNEFRVTVDRNGQVVLPRLSPLAASGRSFGSFRQDVQAAVHRAYVATEASVAVGRLRQISVLVSGEVNNPGQRLVTGLSSALDALILSGGVKKTGSLRAVRILRHGETYTVDLYSILTTGGAGAAMRLADGDRILVPPLGRTIAVAGLVRRPGIYELAPGQASIRVSALMALAGGEEVRGRYRTSVLRIQPDGQSQLAPVGQDDAVRDSEILYVQLAADQTTGQATLSGGTGLAGNFPVVAGSKLSEFLRAPGAMGPAPYTPFGVIVRKDPATLLRVLLPFTPSAVLAGSEDQLLQGDDIIRVFSVNEIQTLTYVVQAYVAGLANQQNAIRNPLGQIGGDNLARAVASQSGQSAELSDISSVPAYVQRQQVVQILNLAAPGTPLALRQAEEARRAQRRDLQNRNPQNSVLGAGPQAQAGIPLTPSMPNQQQQDSQAQNYQPQDYQQQGYQQQDYPGANGFTDQVRPTNGDTAFGAAPAGTDFIPGVGQQQPNLARNYADQVTDPNGYASNREVQTLGQLARQLGVDPLVLVNFLFDYRVRLDGAVRGPGYYFAGPNATLKDLVQAAGGTVNWADESGVELISTAIDRQTGRATTQRAMLPLNQSTLAKYVVRPRDQIRFSQTFADVGVGSVTVQGEVHFPGTFQIIRGERLSELLTRAGGLTNVAYPYGTVFLRQSAAQRERESYQRAASEVQNELVIAMTRIGNDKIDPSTFASMQTFVTELRNQRAVGRVSVVADPSMLAANPGQDMLLEPGDVIYIPQRPSTISVLGQVLQPGSYPFRPGETLRDYISRAGGYDTTADESKTFVVLPDGSARRVETSWLSFASSNNLPPGSSIVVPRDVTPLDLRQSIIDVSQIFSQLAVSIASVAVLSRQ